MKQIRHKQNDSYRVVQRGAKFYVQQNTGTPTTREIDCWCDIGHPKDSSESAVAAMYSRVPLIKAAV